MKRVIGLLLLVALVALGLSFAVLNAEPVALNYYFGSANIPLSLIMVAVLAAGALLGVLASLTVIVRYKARAAQLKRRLSHLENDFHRQKPRESGVLAVH